MSAESVINEARARIGDDGTESWENYDEHAWALGHCAWCAEFLCLCFEQAGEDFNYSASAAGFASQFDRIPDEEATAGDIVFFGWDGIREVYHRDSSHVAIVDEWVHTDEIFSVIEGNSGNGGPEDTHVCRTVYDNEGNYFTAFFRPNYGAAGTPQNSATTTQGTRYRVRTKEYGWHDWMDGLHDTGGSTDDFAGSEGCLIYGFEVEGYDYRIVRCDGSESTNEQGNEASPICGIEIIGDVNYQAHWTDTDGNNGEWGKWEHGSDDNGAGKDEYSPIDMIRVR